MIVSTWSILCVSKLQVDYKSPNMERLGLRKTLNFMTNHLTIVEVATDASTSIKAMLGSYVNVLKLMLH